MTYLKSIVAGIVTSIASRYRSKGSTGMLAVRIFAPLPLAIVLLGFAAGFYVVFRISK